MNFKTTITLIICLLAVGVVVFLTRNTSNEPKPFTPAKYIDISSADVQKLSITPSDGKAVVLERQRANWRMLQPVQALADNDAVETLVSALTSLESTGTSDASGANATVTGLASPNYKIEITDKSGKLT